MTPYEVATRILVAEEGFSAHPYIDTEGYITVGYGLKISRKDANPLDFVAFPTMPEAVAELWMTALVQDAEADLASSWFGSVYEELSVVRKAVCLSMAYQLGHAGFLKFRNTIMAMEDGEFDAAAVHMMDSLWARQTPRRASRHAMMMEEDKINEYYLQFNRTSH